MLANASHSQLVLVVWADINGMLRRSCCTGLSFYWGWLWLAKRQSGVFVQEVLSFCFLVFNCYSMALLNAFQCASTVDMGMSSGGGGRKVCVCMHGGWGEAVGVRVICTICRISQWWTWSIDLPTAWPEGHIAETAKYDSANF